MQNPRDDNVGHFAWIKNLSRLVSSQLSKKEHKKYICDRYSHTINCQQMNECAIRLPSEKNKWLEFNNYNRKKLLLFIVYADLECMLKKTNNDPIMSTYTFQHQEIFSIAYYIHCAYDETLSAYHSRRNVDCIAWFVEKLKNLAHHVKNIISANVPMVTLSHEQYETFRSVTHCHICEKPFAPDDTRVRDHCHLTGRYRGLAHLNCNLNYKNSFYIPIVFHNLSGYDSHFIIKEIATAFEERIDVLPITKKKIYIFYKKC
ncbi:hypothetical protein ACFW04_013726 [Cataglyphis niger]